MWEALVAPTKGSGPLPSQGLSPTRMRLASGDSGKVHIPSDCSPSHLLRESAQLTQSPGEILPLAKHSKNSEGRALEKTGPVMCYLGWCSISVVAWEGSQCEAGYIFQRETQAHRAKGQGTHPPSQPSEVLPGKILSNVLPESSPLGGDPPLGGRVRASSKEAVLPQVETWLVFRFKGMSS